MEDATEFEIPPELSQMGEVMEGDVQELVDKVFADLADLQDKITEGYSMKKKMSSPDLNSIFSRIEKYSELKKILKEESVNAFKSLYTKWTQSLCHLQDVMIEKLEAIVDESTLRTSDFTDSPNSFSVSDSPPEENSHRPKNTWIPNYEYLDPNSGTKVTKRKRSPTISPSEYNSRKKLAQRNALQSAFEMEQESSSEEEEERVPTPFSTRQSLKSYSSKPIATPRSRLSEPVGLKRTRKSVGMTSILKSNVPELTECSSDEETIPKQFVRKALRKSVGFSFNPVVKTDNNSGNSSEEEETVARYSPVKAKSPPATSIARRTRKSVGKTSNFNVKEQEQPTPSNKKSPGSPPKKSAKSNAGPSNSKTAGKFVLGSVWVPLNSLPNKIPASPAVYQIKVHQAKKPAFIGACGNLHDQLLKFQNGESTKQKQLDKFLERNRDNVGVHSQVFDSLKIAEEQRQLQLDSFHESFQKYPVFNFN